MKEQNLLHLNKLRYYMYKVGILILLVYTVIIISLAIYYNNKVAMEKTIILQNQYDKIIEVTMNKFRSLAHQLYNNIQNTKIRVNNNTTDIEICNETNKCIVYNLFQLGTLLNRNIQDFVSYKIELNKNFLYANDKTQYYQINKIYQLTSNDQLNISLAISNTYLHKIESDIKRPFWILTIFLTVNMLLLYCFFIHLFKCFHESYTLYYQDRYSSIFKQLKLHYQQKLKDSEIMLLKKIWNNDFNKQKDLEINCLFAQEANEISLLDNSSNNREDFIRDYKLRNLGSKIPCSIVLYQGNKIEEINITKLVNLFTDRFAQEDEMITVKITSKMKILHFPSNASLYQIIYSIISYLFFLLKKQPSTIKHNINLTIKTINKRVVLLFEYDGYPIATTEELLKISGNFFKTHANPFLLSLIQIFSILKDNGFDYKISNNQNNNIIEVYLNYSNTEQNNNSTKQALNKNSNVVLLTSVIKKNTD